MKKLFNIIAFPFPQCRSLHSYSMVVWHQFDQVLIKCFKVFHQSFCLVLGLAKFSVNLFNTSFLDLRISLVTKF